MAKPKLPPGVRLISGRYYRGRYMGMVDGKRKKKWIGLTRESDGLAALYRALAALENDIGNQDTRMTVRITAWLQQSLPGLSMSEQNETARMAGEVSEAFDTFHTSQVQAKHILLFLQQWSNKGKLRTAQRYRALLNKFFKWVIVQGDRQDNPVEPVSTKVPPPNTYYMTHDVFLAIRDKLLGDDSHKAASGEMMQCYVDLLYLTGQSGMEIRTLTWAQVDEEAGVIHFERSKIKKKTNAKVDVLITPEVAAVLAGAREIIRARQKKAKVARITPAYVITNLDGSTYSAHGVNTAWSRARERAKITDSGVTLKALRAKHATDAAEAGYSVEEISDGLTHAEPGMTRVYLKQKATRKSSIALPYPVKKR